MKHVIMREVFLLIAGMFVIFNVFGNPPEQKPDKENEPVAEDSIVFTPSSASDYIRNILESGNLWRKKGEPLKYSLTRLVDHYSEPFDSVGGRLSKFNFEEIKLRSVEIVERDTLPVRWLNEFTFIIDTIPLEKDPVIRQKTIIRQVVDTLIFVYKDSIPEIVVRVDSMLHKQDTLTEIFIDTLYLKSKKVIMHQLVDNDIVPPLFPRVSRKTIKFVPDSSGIAVSKRFRAIVGDRNSPFYIVPGKQMPDSLHFAVETLLLYTFQRDSIPVSCTLLN